MADEKMITEHLEYDTEYGDTFDSIAFQFYTDEQLSSEIIRANPDYAERQAYRIHCHHGGGRTT